MLQWLPFIKASHFVFVNGKYSKWFPSPRVHTLFFKLGPKSQAAVPYLFVAIHKFLLWISFSHYWVLPTTSEGLPKWFYVDSVSWIRILLDILNWAKVLHLRVFCLSSWRFPCIIQHWKPSPVVFDLPADASMFRDCFRVAVRTTTQMPGPRPIPGHAGSGEPPCGADDEDCMGSGSGDGGVDPVHTPKVVTDDIYITSPEPTRKYPDPWGVEERPHGRSTQNPMVVTVNMTTVTPRRPSVVTTRRTFHASDTPTERPRDLTKEESGGASDTGGMLPPSSSKGKSFNLSSNIIVIVGITAGVLIILLLLAFAIYKYKSRDEGSYKIDESKNYPYQEGAAVAACNKPSSQVNGGSCTRSSHSGMQTASKPKKNVKEWYVWCRAVS